MNSILDETKFLIKKYNISANKSLGQNFLIDDNAVDTIISSAQINKNDFVIEIGPGLGTLTSKLLEQAGKVTAIELDNKMVSILEERFKFYNNFEIIHEDVLKVDLHDLIKQALLLSNGQLKNVKIVANLPY